MSAVFRRIYLVRGRAAFLLCLPGVLLAAWYAFAAFARFDAYRRAESADVELDAELFHIELYDVLREDLRHVRLGLPPQADRLERFSFRMSRSNWESLERSRHREERSYVKAELTRKGKRWPVEVRLLGQRPWNVLYRQRSLKVQLARGELLDGYRVFTLSNDPSPMVVGEQLMLDLLGERGVLVPRADFARVAVNGSDLGVFRYETQPDESLLRARRREPGSMYSGDLPASARSDELWAGAGRWRKVAWRDANEEQDMGELERLLGTLRGASLGEFADFAAHELDVEAFAQLDAIEVAFGSDQHNFRENHKLYFDPYRGRWEPIAWGLRGFEHDPVFNRAENPLLLRLKLVPGYLAQRNRVLYELLTGAGSGAAVRARALALWKRIGPALAADPYWDAYRLLPRVDDFLRQMVRPMNTSRAMLVLDSELETYERRRAFLLARLRDNPLGLVREPGANGETPIQVIVDGEAGALLEGFEVGFSPECADPSWQLERVMPDATRRAVAVSSPARDPAEHPRFDLRVLTRREQTLEAPLTLYPLVRIEARAKADAEHGAVLTQAGPAAYPFVLRSVCAPDEITAIGQSLATRARVRSRQRTPLPPSAAPTLSVGSVPALAAGESSAHPWSFPAPREELVELGPGVVAIESSRVYEPHQRVHVAAGTTLRMSGGASLIFFGPVVFAGSAQAPVWIERTGADAWGGLVLQGRATAGSRLTHVHAHGGSVPAHRQVRFPGMLNLHDTRDITLSHCSVGHNDGSDDVLHAAYVQNLRIEDTRVERAYRDAVDIELSTATVRRFAVEGAGDDALDLMGAEVELAESTLVGTRGNGISAGEESAVRVQDTLIADARVGLLAKNASRIEVDGSLLYRTQTGVRIYKRTVRYEGDSAVDADVVFIVESELPVQREDGKRHGLDVGRAQLGLPASDALDHLRDNVLELFSWSALPAWLAQRQHVEAKP